MLTEEDTSCTLSKVPEPTNQPSATPALTSLNYTDDDHAQLTTGITSMSILSNATMLEDDTCQISQSMEHKDIPSSGQAAHNHGNSYHHIDQDTYVTKQIHETMQEQNEIDEEIMVSSNLLLNGASGQPQGQDMDMIKQVATDFVKSLSQEALEIVKEKMSPERQQQVDSLLLPTVQVTFP